MTFRTLIAQALTRNETIVLVGSQEEAVAPLLEIATHGYFGENIATLKAADLQKSNLSDLFSRNLDESWLLLITGCEISDTSTRALQVSALESDLLDLAFDGDPDLPDNCTVVLSFNKPTGLSDALADDEVPCAFLAPDMRAPSIADEVAALLNKPVIDIEISHLDRSDFCGVPIAA